MLNPVTDRRNKGLRHKEDNPKPAPRPLALRDTWPTRATLGSCAQVQVAPLQMVLTLACHTEWQEPREVKWLGKGSPVSERGHYVECHLGQAVKSYKGQTEKSPP